MRRAIYAALAAVCGVFLTVGYPSHSEAQNKKVLVQFAWVVGGLHAGFFVAQEKGYYAAKGLDVSITRGFGSGDTAKIVAAGKAQFGEANLPTSIISTGRGAPVTIIGVLGGKAPESFLSFEEKGIRKPKDVEGKSFAEATGAAILVAS